MWRHNDVIGRNEYLIFTFSESAVPQVYSLQFLFKSTHQSWRYERKCEWVFFFWTQCRVTAQALYNAVRESVVLSNGWHHGSSTLALAKCSRLQSQLDCTAAWWNPASQLTAVLKCEGKCSYETTGCQKMLLQWCVVVIQTIYLHTRINKNQIFYVKRWNTNRRRYWPENVNIYTENFQCTQETSK